MTGREIVCRLSGSLLLVISLAPTVQAQLPPDEELAQLQAADELAVSLYASEPMITNPAAIDVDTRGRVWVAEIQFYRAKAQNPPADKIKVLEDTDGDGRADKVTTFAEGVFCPMSICVAGAQVFVATSPDLWVYEDRDGDLEADGPPRKLLTGFGGQNHDHGAHSLVLGPDHKWWMSHGDAGFDVTGTDGSQARFRWGAVLRGELDGSQLESVAVNFRNPYEVCVSSFGEAFLSDNDNDGNRSTRICWILEGGNYGWFGHPGPKVPADMPFASGWHFRAEMPGYVPATLVTGFGSPAGICFYEGDALGDRYKNAPIHADPGPREVRVYPHTLAGAGMSATSRTLLTSRADPYFRPDDVCTAPDGSLFVADWYDGGVGGHAYNNPDQGRIFRIRPRDGKLTRKEKPGPYDNVDDAVVALASPNLATQYLARECLLERPQDSVTVLGELLESADGNVKARALWVLDRIGGVAQQLVVRQLRSPDAAFRALAVRILRRHGSEFADPILKMVDDTSAEVRREILLAIPKIKGDAASKVLAKLAQQFDGTDRYLLEAIHIASEGRQAELVGALEKQGALGIPQVELIQLVDPTRATHLLAAALANPNSDARHKEGILAALGRCPTVEAGRTVWRLACDEAVPIDLRKQAMSLFTVNASGVWSSSDGESRPPDGLERLLASGPMQSEALALVDAQHWQSLAPQVLQLVTSADQPTDIRVKAAGVLARLQAPGSAAQLVPLLNGNVPELQDGVLDALVALQDWTVLKPILAQEACADSMAKKAAERLMASTGGALALLRMIDDASLAEGLRAQSIEAGLAHADANVRLLYERFLPPEARSQRLGTAVKPEAILALSGDVQRGENIFFESSAAQCKNCHVVHNRGGNLGPDLSQIGKKYAPDALLETILDPSKAIAPEFVPYVVETKDGRLQAGFVVERNAKQIVLRPADGQVVRINVADIELLAPQQKSVMPELVLQDVTPQDAADLLAYLVSLSETVQSAVRFRIAGPFNSDKGNGLTKAFPPEKNLSNPDVTESFKSMRDRACSWELVSAEEAAGRWVFNLGNRCRDLGLPADGKTYYVLIFAESAAPQAATVSLQTKAGYKLWINGELAHESASAAAQDAASPLRITLAEGRNPLIVKLEDSSGDASFALQLSAPNAVQLRTE